MNKKIAVLTILILSFLIPQTSQAEGKYSIHLDHKTILKGYTVANPKEELKLSLVPGILSEDTAVEMEEIENMPLPWRLEKISPVLQFEFKNKRAYDDKKPFYIQFSYEEDNNDLKKVFFYDKNFNSWRPLPTTDYPQENFVRSLIHLPYARIAVFSYPEILTTGEASWYAYKGGNFAASPDYPKGSKVRVHNLDNGKFVDVTINDYGPDRSIFPNRPIDLDKQAFAQIAPVSQGIARVKVEPLNILEEDNRILGLQDAKAPIVPEIDTKAAIVLGGENNQKMLFSKNINKKLPIASLTKLVAAKVFLDQNIDENKVVEYKKQDAEYNYQYCSKWESSHINLEENEKVTIKDLLYSSLVGSRNNTVETLVRYSGLSREEFINRMNEFAKQAGAESTNFVEPTGLSPKNMSSVYDYAIIGLELSKDKKLKEISTTLRYGFENQSKSDSYFLTNTNKLLFNNGVTSILLGKTGFLNEAGYCLLNAFDYRGEKYVSVVLGANSRDYSFLASEDLYFFTKNLLN